MIGNLKSLDIIGGSDVTTDSCVLRRNQTELIGRGTYDYIVAVRDEMLASRGFTELPYWQESWRVVDRDEKMWEPSDLDHCKIWYSPEFFHAETNNTTLCVQMEDRMGNHNAIQNNTAKMPTFSTDTDARGLDTLDFDGTSDYFDINAAAALKPSTGDWVCCIACIGNEDTDDEQYVMKKGSQFSLRIDRSGSSRNVKFYWDGGTARSIELTSAISTSGFNVFSFGRSGGIPFLRSFIDTVDRSVQYSGTDTGDLDGTAKPRIGRNLSFGSTLAWSAKLIEFVYVDDAGEGTADVNANNIASIEAYLAYKYKKQDNILHAAHRFVDNPPRI